MTTASLSELVDELRRIATCPAYTSNPFWGQISDVIIRGANAIESLTGEGDLGEPPAPQAWKKIETAPKGACILIVGGRFWWDSDSCPTEGEPLTSAVRASWDGEHWKWDGFWATPTHWMPLPKPPSTSSDEVAAPIPSPSEEEMREVLDNELRKHGLLYLGMEPTGKTRDESIILAALSAMRAISQTTRSETELEALGHSCK